MLTNPTRLTVITLVLTLFVSTASSESAARRRARPMTMTATAYCLRGLTSTGSDVRPGIVAADPRVLQMGSRIRVRGPHVNREYVVEDQGASVKGHRIDIFMPSCVEAKKFGRQRVTVTIVHLAPPARMTR